MGLLCRKTAPFGNSMFQEEKVATWATGASRVFGEGSPVVSRWPGKVGTCDTRGGKFRGGTSTLMPLYQLEHSLSGRAPALSGGGAHAPRQGPPYASPMSSNLVSHLLFPPQNEHFKSPHETSHRATDAIFLKLFLPKSVSIAIIDMVEASKTVLQINRSIVHWHWKNVYF